ncbi:Ldh family oxidoreductase [Paenibacillus abyssi]|uniref:Lactate dehydrogenase n=1 Tax=Paenibacillus abyssi TaxID=1340531 RepID=A0A917FMY5_9BACL|nr:Ldh family oxidoreductase [Paenibacillus abyssi]GGF90679.1 lactate dehydrogenase [Paenibacillus abyssi]
MNGAYHYNKLENFCGSLFTKAGVPEQEAKLVAESLVQADLRGVDSHGVIRMDVYLKRLEAGMVTVGGGMNAVSDGPVTLLDGANHFGAVIGSRALEIVMEGTKRNGVSVVGVKGSNHFGTCSYYLLKAVREDMILIVLSNASQTMPPTGGVRPFIGTNPFSVGVPAGKYEPFILDMATSVVARGKIIAAAQRGETIPIGWAIDKHGHATTDADAALEGSVLPVGGAKGYGISLFVDIMSGVLTGAGFGKYVNNMYENWEEAQNVGHFFIGLDIARFMPVDAFKERMDRYFDELKAVPRAPGVLEILIPGELEHRLAQERMLRGIVLPGKVEEELTKWARRYGLDLSEALMNPASTA